ncbi:hypothetical protein [Gilvibacter sediminis]|uniref:hypothetical protein n=1 Tax=Gilvibacter sediminis TaxID=379071 RepID=UPI00234FD054|nr:hypothetical protein [Gilvibacter sediminis]MDC7998896.1 hypothetical protein [Gilvibacter sediminis]
MKKLLLLPLFALLTATTCDVTEDPMDDDLSLIPEAAPGTMAVEADGSILVLSDRVEGAGNEGCLVTMLAENINPDGSSVSIRIRITNVDFTGYTLGDYEASRPDPCMDVRVLLSYQAAGDDGVLEQYSSYNTYNGVGELVVTDFQLNFDDTTPDFVSGTFSVIGGLVGGSGETLEFRGSFNEIPIQYACPTTSC